MAAVLESDLASLKRTRIGVHRASFEVRPSELVVLVVRVGHRSGV